MPAIQIRDVPPEVIAALKRRAVRHERSLEGELRHILSAVAREEPPSSPLPPLELKLSQASPSTTWRREELYGDDGPIRPSFSTPTSCWPRQPHSDPCIAPLW